MRHLTICDCYRVLGLAPTATSAEVRGRFRQLVKQYHPDLHPGRRSHRHFVRITKAYRLLRETFRERPPESEFGPCPRCGKYSDLLIALDGRRSCTRCLLGLTRRGRFLPLPVDVVVKHVAVLVLYGASVAFLFLHVESGRMVHAALSLACGLLGLFVLIGEVFWLARYEPLRPHSHSGGRIRATSGSARSSRAARPAHE